MTLEIFGLDSDATVHAPTAYQVSRPSNSALSGIRPGDLTFEVFNLKISTGVTMEVTALDGDAGLRPPSVYQV